MNCKSLLIGFFIFLLGCEQNNPNKNIVVIENKYKTADGYSGHVYDITSATKDGVIYPSLDPSIFELKYPNTDIEGRVIGDI